MSCDSPNRLVQVEMVVVQEGEEPNDFRALVGDMNCYYSLVKGNTHIAHKHTSPTYTLHTHTCTHTTHTRHTHTHTTHTHTHTMHTYTTQHTLHTHRKHTTHTHSPHTIVHTCTCTPPDVRLHNYIP